jgi:hypothetical protein
MADFDATFQLHPDDHELVEAMMLAARRRARSMGVRWRSTLNAEGRLLLRIGQHIQAGHAA